MSKNRFIAYVRVADENSTSAQMQEQRVRQYAKQHGLEIVEVVTEVGLGGYRVLPVERILSAIERQAADGVIVTDLSRLGRSPVTVLKALSALSGPETRVLTVSGEVPPREILGAILNIWETLDREARADAGGR